MRIQINQHPIASLPRLATVPTAFEVDRVFDVSECSGAAGGFSLTERRIDRPYTKDYDAIAGNAPHDWRASFDVTPWCLLVASAGDDWVGGAVIAVDTPELHALANSRDAAVLWDIRVAPATRGQSVGSALFRAAADWSVRRGFARLVVETQNINVPACRFYARQGCKLHAVRRGAYPPLPDEIQFIWSLDLPAGRG